MKITNDKPIVDFDSTIDREQVFLIYKTLERQNVVLITGAAGIGKTTVALLYQYKYGHEYDGTSRIDYRKFDDPKNQIDTIIRDLNKFSGKRLLMIDNIDEIGLVFFSQRYGTINKNCHVILISRVIVKNLRFPIITISGLSRSEAEQLIEKLFERKYAQKEKAIFNELSNFSEGNPLVIKLMSGIYNQKEYKSLSDFRNELAHNLAFTLGVAKKPIEIYIDTEKPDQIEKVYNQTIEFIKNRSLDIEEELPPEEGSWYKRLFVKIREVSQSEELKEKVNEAEYGIKLHAITKQQSEIDKNQAEAVSSIIESIKEIPNAAIKVGSILIVKVTNSEVPTISVKSLSLSEMLALENRPSLLKNPTELLESLGQFKHESAD